MSHDPEAECEQATVMHNACGWMDWETAVTIGSALAAAGYTVTRDRYEPDTTWDALVECCMDNYPADPDHGGDPQPWGGDVTYRVVKDEPCEWQAQTTVCGGKHPIMRCPGCNGDGTRMVEVAVVELDDGRPTGVMTPIEPTIVQNPPPTPPQVVIYDGDFTVDRRRRWVEVEP